MMKFAIAAAVAAMFVVSPAFAAGKLKCNAASMKKLDGMVHDMMADPKMKKQAEMAMAESEMAGKLKKKGDIKGCAMHLNMGQEDLMAHG
jgi:outer membrane lipoprotein-sorting protein